MRDLANQTILVVGGAKGIGKALCETLDASGAVLHVADLEEIASGGSKTSTHRLDMTDRAATRAFFANRQAEGTRFDGAVILAAVHGGCPAEKMPDDFIARILDVNLGAHMALVRELVPLMARDGRIIGISSNCAEVGIPMESAYAATKAGLERFYEALAIETADRGLRPIVVQVGNVNTGFNETGNVYEPDGQDYVDIAYRQVVGKIDSANGMPPADVARAIAGLLSAANPPFRALVGMNAKKTYWARRLLGTRMSLKLVTSVFGLKPG